MTFDQTSKIMEVLEIAYPQFYNGKYAPDRRKAVALWASMFADDDVTLALNAVKAIIKANASQFPPSIGEIRDKMHQLSSRGSMTEAEAWSLVHRAIRNGVYGAQEEFDRLPRQLQRLVGSPDQIRAWAMLDDDEVQTVVSSNFQRSYRARAKEDRDFDKLPESVKQYSQALAESLKMGTLEKGQERKQLEAPKKTERIDMANVCRDPSEHVRRFMDKMGGGLDSAKPEAKPDPIERDAMIITEDARRAALERFQAVFGSRAAV